ncbi:PLP-dependent aminotransferase family protein [Streptomyces sp. ODS28]|uniref:MocR-like pyridoxine biosynthesis transcription factor PdxR n=1 Tax=Streptomyces sp. ODS28 TaxID=3136688 RepID=UPI0031EA94A7
MPSNWATSLDLHLDDVRGGGRGSGVALVRALREAVRSGRLSPGTKLPSSRALAADLGMARNTVADAYAELVAAGWLTARQGSGTRVAQRAEPQRARAGRPAPPPRHPLNPAATYNLLPGQPDASAFPRTAWSAATRRALAAAPSEAFGYQGPAGRTELRHALADYLARVRGVDADPERTVVCAGFTHGLAALARVLRAAGVRRAAVESYGAPHHRALLAGAGVRLAALPYDEDGTATAALPELDVQAALLTPAHQFPTGVALPARRRATAVDWARAADGLLVEDDYDGEFRYDRQPVGALQGLDPERVVYCGTASKSLAPALRLGWMVLPHRLVGEMQEALSGPGQGGVVGSVEQLTLAEFLRSGAYDRHVRAMRGRYRRRRDRLVAELARKCPQVRVSGISAGLHALVELPEGAEEQRVVRAAAREGLAVGGLEHLTHAPAAVPRGALVVGYATPPEHLFPGALAALCRALNAQR